MSIIAPNVEQNSKNYFLFQTQLSILLNARNAVQRTQPSDCQGSPLLVHLSQLELLPLAVEATAVSPEAVDHD